MWGLYEAAGTAMDMVLALPADTLSRLGFKGLPPSAMLPIAVTGTAQQPHVDWTRYCPCACCAALGRTFLLVCKCHAGFHCQHPLMPDV